jgi:hypothetical protein
VESFYHLPHGEHTGQACQGTACFAAKHLNPARWAEAAAQNPRVYCLGECFAAPAKGQTRPRPPVKVFSPQGIVLGRIAAGGARSLAAAQKMGGYAALAQALTQSPEQLLAAVETSGLRGRGGAGFPTGRKWRAVAAQPAGTKYVVANADEGIAAKLSVTVVRPQLLMWSSPMRPSLNVAITDKVVGDGITDEVVT